MSNSRLAVLRDMIELREGRLVNGTNLTLANRRSISDELNALRYAIKVCEGVVVRQHPPAGVAWDHHHAIHADCDWDWSNVPSTTTFTAIDHQLFGPEQRLSIHDSGDVFVGTYRLCAVERRSR